MNKPYITLKHIIIEIVSLVLIVISIAIGVAYVAAGDGKSISNDLVNVQSRGELLILPFMMLFVCVILILAVHFVPPRFYNTPVKIKPECEIASYVVMTLMLDVASLIMALMSLLIMIFVENETAIIIISFGSVAVLFLDVALSIVWLIRMNMK